MPVWVVKWDRIGPINSRQQRRRSSVPQILPCLAAEDPDASRTRRSELVETLLDLAEIVSHYDRSLCHSEVPYIKKYVVSRSGDVDTSWQGSVLLRDIADVMRLREEDGPNLVTQGSTELVHALQRTSSTR